MSQVFPSSLTSMGPATVIIFPTSAVAREPLIARLVQSMKKNLPNMDHILPEVLNLAIHVLKSQ